MVYRLAKTDQEQLREFHAKAVELPSHLIGLPHGIGCRGECVYLVLRTRDQVDAVKPHVGDALEGLCEGAGAEGMCHRGEPDGHVRS